MLNHGLLREIRHHALFYSSFLPFLMVHLYFFTAMENADLWERISPSQIADPTCLADLINWQSNYADEQFSLIVPDSIRGAFR